MNKNVLVFGATGKTGNEICKALELKNITYSVFVREKSSGKITSDDGEIIHGDVLNTRDVENAFNGAGFTDVVISLGSAALKNTVIRSQGTEHIIEAMKKAQSKASIHVISALGVGDSWNQLKWLAKMISKYLLKSVMDDHGRQEELVIKSTFPYHILRPVGLKDGHSKGDVQVQNEGFLSSGYVQRTDVAKYLVESLIEGKTGVSAICQNKG
jgi:nucleoside-diphosphate-sugar epimerase